MQSPDRREYERKCREVRLKVAGMQHLYIETCDRCNMPFIQAFGYRPYLICEPCRAAIKEEMKLQRKAKRDQAKLRLKS